MGGSAQYDVLRLSDIFWFHAHNEFYLERNMGTRLQPGALIVDREAIVRIASEKVGQAGGQLVGRVIDAVREVNARSLNRVIIGIEQDGSRLFILGAKQAQLTGLPVGNIDDGFNVVYTRTEQDPDPDRGVAFKVELQSLVREKTGVIRPLLVIWP
jgi:hypothetical protein